MTKDETRPGGEEEHAPAGTGGEAAPETPPANPEAQIRKELDEARAAAQANRDQFLRKAAEFENYKRRTETEFANIVRNANEGLIHALLPIVEDLTRSLKAGIGETDAAAFYRGVELIFQKLMKVLEAQGVTAFESAGKPFDVEYHDALLQVARDDVPPGTVVEEIAPGYKLNDRVLRHARVIVSSAPENENAPGGTVPPETSGPSKESTRH